MLIKSIIWLSGLALAAPYSQRINTATYPVPPNFGSSLYTKLANLDNIPNITTICVDNRTAGEVAVNCSSHSATTSGSTPSDDSVNNIYVNASQSTCLDSPSLKGDCYIRSMTGATISSGVVVVTTISK